MLTTEFDTEFDVLYNNITSNQAPGLNGYEKSVFLTKAQNQLVQEYFNPRLDGSNGGFDGSPKRQIDFDAITVTKSLSVATLSQQYTKIDLRSFVYDLSDLGDDLISILNEFVDVTEARGAVSTSYTLSVMPLSYNEYQRLMNKPYKFPPKGMAWRLRGTGTYVEIISPCLENNSVSYRLRYVRKPSPIILEPRLDLLNVSIDGVAGPNDTNTYEWTPTNPSGLSTIRECELPEEMHHEILERAVTLAKIAWQGATMTQAAMASQANKN